MKVRLSRETEADVIARVLDLLKDHKNWTLDGTSVVKLDPDLTQRRLGEGDFEKKMSALFPLPHGFQMWLGVWGTPLNFHIWFPSIRLRIVPRLKLWWGVRQMLKAKASEEGDAQGQALVWQLNRAKDRAVNGPPPTPAITGSVSGIRTPSIDTLTSSVATNQYLLKTYEEAAREQLYGMWGRNDPNKR